MSNRRIGGKQFVHMIRCALARLQSQVDIVNALNVFPVPDGDTGSNMLKTMQSGFTYVLQYEKQQAETKPFLSVGQVAQSFAKGLLLGARGNSGVILSQLFHGIAKSLVERDEAEIEQLAAALNSGVETAYASVVTPVEGTILTVAKQAAQTGSEMTSRSDDCTVWFESVLNGASAALKATPDQLPILKEAGVVDSGGQGLVFILEGFVDALRNEAGDSSVYSTVDAIVGSDEAETSATVSTSILHQSDTNDPAQTKFAEADIVHFYDLEFFIRLHAQTGALAEEEVVKQLTNRLSQIGDSVIVIPDERVVKVHVHSNEPGQVLNIALEHGELIDIHIQNMREQYRAIQSNATSNATSSATPNSAPKTTSGPCIVAIASGEGIARLFESLGNVHTIYGGDTMNASAEEIIRACEDTGADHVFLLPNNSNILMAAEQAAKLSDRPIHVIPTRSIAQGLSAAVSFDVKATVDVNKANMQSALQNVKSGHVTFAVREANVDQLHMKENDFLGVSENKIVAVSPELFEVCQQLLDAMLDGDDELLTVIVGSYADKKVTERLELWINQQYPSIDVEFHDGGQPLQFYIFAIE